jgi:acylphosphatase
MKYSWPGGYALKECARLRAVARGVVQGVGFRWLVRRKAEALDLVGYAENLADGTVEVVAEGIPADLDEFEAHLRRGAGVATVTHLDVQRGHATGEFRGFAVK